MALRHATIKTSGQKLSAAADWNVDHIIHNGILNFPGGSVIKEEANYLTILPVAGRYIRIGDAGVTSRGLNKNDDLFVSGKLEVDGETYFDSAVRGYNSIHCYKGPFQCNDTSSGFIWHRSGSDYMMIQKDDAVSTHPTLRLGLTASNNQFLIVAMPYVSKSYDHADQTNPTVFIHSATNPDTANDEWISFNHDVTDGVITTGKGDISLVPVAGSYVKFGAYVAAAATDSIGYIYIHDAGGTLRKVMIQA